MTEENKPPFPPFTLETATEKVRLAEDGWNTRDPSRVALAYTIDSKWRNRAEIFEGREKIIEFLTRKWNTEHEYRLTKELWAFYENRIAVRFVYEWRDDAANWYRAYGNENWEFGKNGQMKVRHCSINDRRISEEERKFYWPLGRRPDDTPSLTELGF